MQRFFPSGRDFSYSCTIRSYSKRWLLWVRITGFAFCLFLVISTFFLGYNDSIMRYFTQWGLFITSFAQIGLLINHYIGHKIGITIIKTLHMTGKLRKPFLIVLILFEVSWTSEMLITVVFWIFLFKDTLEARGFEFVHTVLVHVVPFVYVALDMGFNQIRFLKFHVLFPVLLLFVWGIVDIAVTFAIDQSAYPILTWHSYVSALVALLECLLPLSCFSCLDFY